jgi:primosomal protein N' (replication factor Y) (superfamily II helicase)
MPKGLRGRLRTLARSPRDGGVLEEPIYAQVLVFLPIHGKATPFFDYTVPPALADEVRPGVMVAVPFRERRLPALVWSLSETPSVPKTRPIGEVLTPEPVLSTPLRELARWMARETLAPLYECVQTMLPPGMRADSLEDFRGRIGPKTVRMASLAVPRSAWPERMEGLRLVELYRSILTYLEQAEAPVDVSTVYAETGAEYRHLQMLHERGLIDFTHEERIRDPLADMLFTPKEAPDLLPDQQEVWQVVNASLEVTPDERVAPVLLLGVTGSGKTEIYLRATERALAQGRQALILVPEISLTPQTVRRFVVRFPDQVGVWHSGMSAGERYDTWRRIRAGELSILVGARSALFAPFPDLGLIVMDEEEDTSYKSLRRPYYHARETAEALAARAGALFIMGSATPSLEAYVRARRGRYRLLEMPRRVLSHRRRIEDWQRVLDLPQSQYRALPEAPAVCTISLPPVRIVDMRAELKAGNRSIFSRPLQDAVDRALAQQEQVILFLNRRGSSTHVFCRDCGWVAECPNCDIPLTYHRSAEALICHRCSYHEPMVAHCPACGSHRVRAFGLGTEGLEQRVIGRWPEARLLRWDRDVARNHAAHVRLMARFATGDVDVLVGTQMIARGLDLPRVTVVGVVSADVGLHLPDFRASERTFQLLAQVAGRAGRGLLGGEAVLQTYHPDHYAITHAAVHDYVGFARRELRFREESGYPPVMRMARLLTRHKQARKAKEAAEALAAQLEVALQAEGLPPSDLIGPAPAFFARVRGKYRWHLLLRHLDPPAFLRTVPIPPGWRVDIDPVDVL